MLRRVERHIVANEVNNGNKHDKRNAYDIENSKSTAWQTMKIKNLHSNIKYISENRSSPRGFAAADGFHEPLGVAFRAPNDPGDPKGPLLWLHGLFWLGVCKAK